MKHFQAYSLKLRALIDELVAVSARDLH